MSERNEMDNPVGAVMTNELLRATPEKEIFTDGDTDINYVANGQILVKITLAEYRSLLRRNAEDKVREANSKRWEAERERYALKNQVSELKKQLDDLRSMIAGAAMKAPQHEEK